MFLEPGKHGQVFANGLEATRNRLVVAGSVTGLILVYDLPRGRLVRSFSTGSGGLINDVTVTPGGDVYATDSMRGLIFRIAARAIAHRRSGVKRIRPFLNVGPTPIGSFANGIVPAGRRYLLVVGLSTGVLGRIDLKTKRVRAVDLHGASLPAGDGLARAGRTLYAVNAATRVTQLRLTSNWLSGRVQRQITSPRFRFPTTLAIAGSRLLVVNSQFDRRMSAAGPALHGVGGQAAVGKLASLCISSKVARSCRRPGRMQRCGGRIPRARSGLGFRRRRAAASDSAATRNRAGAPVAGRGARLRRRVLPLWADHESGAAGLRS